MPPAPAPGTPPPAPAPGLSAGLPGNRPHYNKQQFMRVPHGASGYVGEVCSHPARAHVFWGAPGGVPQDGCRSHATGPVAWVCPQARARAGASPGFRPRLRNRTEPVRDPPPRTHKRAEPARGLVADRGAGNPETAQCQPEPPPRSGGHRSQVKDVLGHHGAINGATGATHGQQYGQVRSECDIVPLGTRM